MCGRVMRFGAFSLAILVLMLQAGWGRARFETQIKRIVVLDANDIPVPHARVYREECPAAWDTRTQAVRLTDDTPWQRTDANGVFSFEFVRQGVGHRYFITDASFRQMGCLYIARQDQAEIYTLRLEKPARLKGVIRSADITFSEMLVHLDYRAPKALFPLLSVDYPLETPVHELALDLWCPAGCDLTLRLEPKGWGIKKTLDISPQKPGQVFDMGAIELRPSSGFKTVGQPAPELQVAEWVKGEPVTLTELKGKVVLLEFWALWCPSCRKAWPNLVELHKKYARSGLVIIAIHDASESKASLLEKGRQLVNFEDTPFRVAVDAPPREDGRVLLGGKTIGAYGVTSLPTLVLVDRDGQVRTFPEGEEDLYLLLHGHPMTKPTTFLGRLVMANHPLSVRIALATGLILLLGLALIALRLRNLWYH